MLCRICYGNCRTDKPPVGTVCSGCYRLACVQIVAALSTENIALRAKCDQLEAQVSHVRSALGHSPDLSDCLSAQPESK